LTRKVILRLLIRIYRYKNRMTLKFSQYYILILLLILGSEAFSQAINHWETIIDTEDSCKYYIPTSDIGTNLISKDFNDTSWITAKSGIGYGDNDDNTTISSGVSSVYIRYNFTINNISQIAALLLDMDFDDGFIAYLNGKEIARFNVEDPVSWDMELNGLNDAALYSGGDPERFEISRFINELLLDGSASGCGSISGSERLPS